MQVIIYGKDNCPNCAKTQMLCQIKSLDFRYQTVGTDISIDELNAKVGHAVQSLPQIFLEQDHATRHIGGYEQLRTAV
ncbi:MAG TPA: glutaredoxin domain-containing protein [Oleiagrimonas sp.]|nr:glutaredoxin domain-containing protein [Oleiagrimonas sp.]